MNIGECIKEARKLAGFTQQVLATKAGISFMSVRRYETGDRTPNLATLQKIANALEVPLDTMLGGIETFDSGADFEARLKEIREASAGKECDSLTIVHKSSAKSRIELAFSNLNDAGKEVAAQRIEELTKISDYQKEE